MDRALFIADPTLPASVVGAIRPDGSLVRGVPRADLAAALQIVRGACESQGRAKAYRATLGLSATARRRDGDEADEALARAAYADALARFPPDVVAAACTKIQASSPFWPAISELTEACEQEVRPRRVLLRAITMALAEPEGEPETREQRLQTSARLWRDRGRPDRAARYERALERLGAE